MGMGKALVGSNTTLSASLNPSNYTSTPPKVIRELSWNLFSMRLWLSSSLEISNAQEEEERDAIIEQIRKWGWLGNPNQAGVELVIDEFKFESESEWEEEEEEEEEEELEFDEMKPKKKMKKRKRKELAEKKAKKYVRGLLTNCDGSNNEEKGNMDDLKELSDDIEGEKLLGLERRINSKEEEEDISFQVNQTKETTKDDEDVEDLEPIVKKRRKNYLSVLISDQLLKVKEKYESARMQDLISLAESPTTTHESNDSIMDEEEEAEENNSDNNNGNDNNSSKPRKKREASRRLTRQSLTMRFCIEFIFIFIIFLVWNLLSSRISVKR